MRPLRDPEGHEAKYLLLSSPLTGKEILEVGCGDGWLTWQFADGAGRVFGIDPGFADLQIAREDQGAHTNVHLAGCMGEALPFPSSRFDIAFFSNTL